MTSGNGFGTVVKVLEPLRESAAGRLDVRIVEVRGERRVDIRQHVTSEDFVGYTRKGVCLTAEEFDALLEQRERIVELLAVPARRT